MKTAEVKSNITVNPINGFIGAELKGVDLSRPERIRARLTSRPAGCIYYE